ncbi:hypothetical protein XENORESO_013525 [Xenotaenia resolanae]|uniref:Uncharacterized protein n=1 Tax=Xenotaenia resolanae TaxID=208358 RepID=A0ABV0VX08_9TELE
MNVSLILQFGSSFATFRPALSYSGSTRPFSVILPVPASPPYIRPLGSSSTSPTSKVPMWKVCCPCTALIFQFHLLLCSSWMCSAEFRLFYHFLHLILSFISTLLCIFKTFIMGCSVCMHSFF